MSASLVLIVVMAALYACGIYLMLERSMTRVLLGFLLVGNATNILILTMSGRSGEAPHCASTARQARAESVTHERLACDMQRARACAQCAVCIAGAGARGRVSLGAQRPPPPSRHRDHRARRWAARTRARRCIGVWCE